MFFFKCDTESIGEYIASGASSVVLSDAIFDKEAMNRKDFDKIYQLAKFAAVQGNVAAKQLGLACHSGYPPSFFGNINFFYDSFPSLLKKLQ